MRKLSTENIRNILFGIEDSLVSTSGFLFGLATADYTRDQVFVAGIIIITVEAVSMGAGAFLTEEETIEIDSKRKADESPIKDGLLMLVSYFIAGFIPLTPFLLLEANTAKLVSLAASVTALFFLGYLPTKRVKSGFRMVIIAGLAASVGFIVGSVLKI